MLIGLCYISSLFAFALRFNIHFDGWRTGKYWRSSGRGRIPQCGKRESSLGGHAHQRVSGEAVPDGSHLQSVNSHAAASLQRELRWVLWQPVHRPAAAQHEELSAHLRSKELGYHVPAGSAEFRRAGESGGWDTKAIRSPAHAGRDQHQAWGCEQ